MPAKNGPWVTMLKENGASRTIDALQACIAADIFLMRAVESTDIDWCIDRLKKVKKAKGDIDTVLEIVLGEVVPEKTGSDSGAMES